MREISIKQLAEVVDGSIVAGGTTGSIRRIVIDSRKAQIGDLYIPIVGENLDGHRFIVDAVENGAAVVLTEQDPSMIPEGPTVIAVERTVRALQKIGGWFREQCEIPVVAVTGSSGKTTTKDIIAAVLSEGFCTLKTDGNFNNYIGVPQTLMRLEDCHEAAVIEMGMGYMDEIGENAAFVRPHYAVITNIGTAHLEVLKTRENILKAKMKIAEALTVDDFLILNGDDLILKTVENTPAKIIRVGLYEDDLEFRGEILEEDAHGTLFRVRNETYRFPYPGVHNVYNALCAIAIAKDLGISQEMIQKGFDAFVPSGNRMKFYTADGMTIIDDTYNANPEAMKAALSVLRVVGKNGCRIAVLGDMLELGDDSYEAHVRIGQALSEFTDVLIAVGSESMGYCEGAKDSLEKEAIYHCESAEEAAALLDTVAHEGDTVLVKASHGMHLDLVVSHIAMGTK